MEFTFGDAGLYHHFKDRDLEKTPEKYCSRREVMELQCQGFEFWPVEHPLEPLDEDSPVKCPLLASSPINDGKVQQRGVAAELAREPAVRVRAAPVRAVRKRQLTLSGGEQGKARVAPLPPLQPNNDMTIFQMLQEFDKFDKSLGYLKNVN